MRTQTTSNETVEMYLKTVAELSEDNAPVIIARIAERLGVTTVSANEMMKRLAAQDLLVHERYKGVRLTENGRFIAHSIMRRQRLWECFLVDHLQVDWAAVYEMACRLEHATSNVLAEKLSAFLDHPQVCPHGRPIPLSDGTMPAVDTRPLTTLKVGDSGKIHSIRPTTTEIFSYFNRHHVLPNRPFTILEIAPLNGPILLDLQDSQVGLGRSIAALVQVTK